MNPWPYKKKSGKKLFFLYKSIHLDPIITIANISASNCPICMILDSFDLSHLVARSSEKNGHIYNKSNISTFKVMQRSTQGQRKMLDKKRLTLLVLLIHGYEAYCNIFRLISCMSSISRHDRILNTLITLHTMHHNFELDTLFIRAERCDTVNTLLQIYDVARVMCSGHIVGRGSHTGAAI